jgi:hypothetical protein
MISSAEIGFPTLHRAWQCKARHMLTAIVTNVGLTNDGAAEIACARRRIFPTVVRKCNGQGDASPQFA